MTNGKGGGGSWIHSTLELGVHRMFIASGRWGNFLGEIQGEIDYEKHGGGLVLDIVVYDIVIAIVRICILKKLFVIAIVVMKIFI